MIKAFHARLGQIRVLDPACGSGHFLIAAARRIGALLRVKQDRRRRFSRGQQDRLEALLEESETEPAAVTSALEIQNRQHDERG